MLLSECLMKFICFFIIIIIIFSVLYSYWDIQYRELQTRINELNEHFTYFEPKLRHFR